jgi:hypothetical protein
MRKAGSGPFLLLAALMLLSGASLAARQKQEPASGKGGDDDLAGSLQKLLADEFARRVATADRWEVKLSPAGSDLAAGKISGIQVRGINVRTPDGLLIPEVTLSVQNLQVSLENGSFTASAGSRFTARLGAEAVTHFLQQRGAEDFKDIRVALRDGRMEVSATAEKFRVAVPLEVIGAPRLRRNAVDFQADRVSVARLRLPRVVVRELERRVNPVVDLRSLKIPVELKRVSIDGDQLFVEASLDLSKSVPLPGTKPAKGL